MTWHMQSTTHWTVEVQAPLRARTIPAPLCPSVTSAQHAARAISRHTPTVLPVFSRSARKWTFACHQKAATFVLLAASLTWLLKPIAMGVWLSHVSHHERRILSMCPIHWHNFSCFGFEYSQCTTSLKYVALSYIRELSRVTSLPCCAGSSVWTFLPRTDIANGRSGPALRFHVLVFRGPFILCLFEKNEGYISQ